MTELRFEDEIFLSADLSGQSAMPAMKANGGGTLKYELSDEAGLYIGFGSRSCGGCPCPCSCCYACGAH